MAGDACYFSVVRLGLGRLFEAEKNIRRALSTSNWFQSSKIDCTRIPVERLGIENATRIL
jgi:hypothetical protein